MSVDEAIADAGGAARIRESLEQVIGLVDAGELNASPAERAYLAGVLEGLRGVVALAATP